MSRFEQAVLDPAGVYDSPGAVYEDPALSAEEKIRILRRWEYDARELEVAEEENMGGGAADVLDEVMAALRKLGAVGDIEHSSPTKQGGH